MFKPILRKAFNFSGATIRRSTLCARGQRRTGRLASARRHRKDSRSRLHGERQ